MDLSLQVVREAKVESNAGEFAASIEKELDGLQSGDVRSARRLLQAVEYERKNFYKRAVRPYDVSVEPLKNLETIIKQWIAFNTPKKPVGAVSARVIRFSADDETMDQIEKYLSKKVGQYEVEKA